MLMMTVMFRPSYFNSVRESLLRAGIFRRSDPWAGGSAPTLLEEIRYTPWMVENTVVWKDGSGTILSSGEVVDSVVDAFLRAIQQRSAK
jgi:hypothetical protein